MLVALASCGGEDGAPRRAAPLTIEEPPAARLARAVAWVAEDQRQPQGFPGGYALHAGDLHARFDAFGVEVDGLRFDLQAGPTEPEVEGSRVVYRREGGLTEWYESTSSGIEQGFVVDERPAGDLIVRGAVEARDAARPLDDGVAWGELRYTNLRAFDAAGRPLYASLEWHAAAQAIVLRVAAEDLDGAEFPVVLDPLLSVVAWAADPTADFAADQASAFFGYSVASAGDVNGDGYADAVVGAHQWDSASFLNEGKAYVFYGGASGLAVVPSWMADPTDQIFAAFGRAVAGAGDINGDGYGDLLVAAPMWNSASYSDEGRVYVYFGSATGLGSAPVTLDPTDQVGSQFGSSVAGAGDVDGDGYADLVIGAPMWNGPGFFDEGRAFVYFGASGGLAAGPPWTADPTEQFTAKFGASVASAGDVNGDGYADVIMGANLWNSASYADEGRAYVYLGGATGLPAASSWLAEPADEVNAQFGLSVASAGDTNGDGYADVVIGAPLWGDDVVGTSDEGRAYVYLGASTGLGSAPVTLDPTDQPGAQFGYSVAGAGDSNGDGYADVIVGANLWDSVPSTDEGRAFLYLGAAAGLATTAAWTVDPADQANAQFGYSVAGAGDVDGDGFGDALVGAYLWDGAVADEGRTYLFRGTATGLTSGSTWTADPTDATGSFFGVSVAGAGDVNGDGFGDVIVGAYAASGDVVNEGRAYLFPGSASGLAAAPTWTADPADLTGASFGWSVAGAGDVNGDGFADVIVGAYAANGDLANEGRAYLFYGLGTGLGATPAASLDPTDQPGARFGYSVAGAGDVNGDGFADVIAGAYWWDGTVADVGRAYVYLGRASPAPSTPAWAVTPTAAGTSWFGFSVSGAGDVNGDGFADVAVGAPASTGGLAGEGRASVYHGSSAGLAISPAWTAEPSDQANAQFGYAVSRAGDVNRDGFDDLLVGANLWGDGTVGSLDEGRAYLYPGGTAGLAASATWTADPTDQAGAEFGNALAPAGDVNGDGYADVVVGVYRWDSTGFANEGVAMVYHGGASGLATIPAFGAEPADQVGAGFGRSVGSADVNGDGFGDVIVGAYQWNGPGTPNEGRAYLYAGGDAAAGKPRDLQQYRADGTTRIGVGNVAGSASVVLKGRVTQEGWLGGRLRLEVEAKLVGTPWSGSGTVFSPTVIEGALASATVTPATGGSYRWRARVVYPVGGGKGRWSSFGGNGEGDPDFVTAQPNGLACTAGGVCASGICEDGICCAAACGLCSSCNAAGTSCAVAPPDDAGCGTIDCDGIDTTCRDYADLTAERCQSAGTCKAPNSPSCTSFTNALAATDCGTCSACDGAGVCLADLAQNLDCPSCQQCTGLGACGFQSSGADVKSDCPAGTCLTGACDGAGGCGFETSGSDCGTCAACNGAGACLADLAQSVDCAACQQCTGLGACGFQSSGADVKSDCPAGTCLTGACDGAGACAPELAGTSCGTCSACNASGACSVLPADDAACGTIDCDGLDTQCRDYHDLLAARCAAVGACNEPNSPACASFDDLTGACDDASVCTTGDACAGGLCTGAPIVCDDANPCTVDACEPVAGCFVTPTTCNDGDACTDDACDSVTGCFATPTICNDGNVCTDDACDSATGCLFTPNAAACDDGSICTTGEACSGGACVGTPVSCDDGDACTDDACDSGVGCFSTPTSCDDANACTDDACDSAVGCLFTPNTAACADGSVCTTGEACFGGVCVGTPVSCDDANACTDDACDPLAGCFGTPTPCDDGDFCTDDACEPASGCAYTPTTCDDANACTDDACEPASGCFVTPTTCDDGDVCTNDACDPATGCLLGPTTCDDGDACTDDACDSVDGCFVTPTACDDANACTADACDSLAGCFVTPITCDDANACTNDACNPAFGCAYTPNALPCDDADDCTTGDQCAAGACEGTPVACDDGDPCSTEACVPATGICAFTAVNEGEICSTATICGGTCEGGVCSDGMPIDCADGDACTTDTCDEATFMCAYPPVVCDDGDPCTDDSCDPASGCVTTFGVAACDDGDPCTTDDACDGAGACAGTPDPACVPDGGGPLDAGPPDAAPLDAAPPDAPVVMPADGPVSDAAPTEDQGVTMDAISDGQPDMGVQPTADARPDTDGAVASDDGDGGPTSNGSEPGGCCSVVGGANTAPRTGPAWPWLLAGLAVLLRARSRRRRR
ncbi:MAG: FG-GAP-like repeat-containing protein [Myxococcota bacterium]